MLVYRLILVLAITAHEAAFAGIREPCVICVELKVAGTSNTRQKGLAGRFALGQDEGLLLIYEKPCFAQIWSLGMQQDLDIAFIDHNHVVLAIMALPCYPQLYHQALSETMPALKSRIHSFFLARSLRCPKPCSFVIEMPRGWFSRQSILPGDRLQWPHAATGEVIEQLEHLPQN